MADAMTLTKLPAEKISVFNKRLLQACQQQPVTSAQLLVIDGEPAVTLFSEMEEATEEDVSDGSAEKVGELIPEEDPVLVQVCRMQADSDDAASKTQQHMEVLFERADGAVIEILHATGSRSGFIEGPDKRTHYVQAPVHYVLVSYLPSDEDDGEDADGDQAMESRLRRPATADKP